MKKLMLFVSFNTLLICSTLSFAQSSSRKIISWEAGNKDVTEFKTGTETSYTFYFRNLKYTAITDIKYENIGSKDDFIDFTNFADSLLNKVIVEKGQTINYSVGNIKNIYLNKMMGQNVITLHDNRMLGYCYIDKNDVKKMKSAILKM